VFGPVPSKRLGQSLGVNTVPRKTCTYSCAYCQLGRTTHLSVTRRIYFATDSVVREIGDKLLRVPTRPDYVTFLGHGEPTLASNIGDILDGLSGVSGSRKALMTNGSLLWMPEVRKEVLGFDVVMPTVSAGSESVFSRIHRPHPALRFDDVIRGIEKFSEEFPGKIWVEVMLVRGINDDRKSLEDIERVLSCIRADEIHLTAPTRPPAEKWVKCPTRESVEMALDIIPGACDMTEQETGGFGASERTVIEDMLAIAAVHPLREEQALGILAASGMSRSKAIEALRHLVDGSAIARVEHRGIVYYRTGR